MSAQIGAAVLLAHRPHRNVSLLLSKPSLIAHSGQACAPGSFPWIYYAILISIPTERILCGQCHCPEIEKH